MKTENEPVQGLPGTLLGGSYKSCQHGLPQAFSFSNTEGVRHCFSSSPPPSIFLEKTFCVPTMFTDVLASWPFCCARASLSPCHSKWPLFRPTAHTCASRPHGPLASQSLAQEPNKKLFIYTPVYMQQLKSLISMSYTVPT